TVFKGSLELLTEQVAAGQPQLGTLLHNMTLQSERMEALVRDLLLLSRLEGTAASHHEPVSLDALTDTLASTFNARAAALQRQLGWDIAPGLNINGNADELASAFANLIDNALAYTPAGGHIHVRCHADAGSIN